MWCGLILLFVLSVQGSRGQYEVSKEQFRHLFNEFMKEYQEKEVLNTRKSHLKELKTERSLMQRDDDTDYVTQEEFDQEISTITAMIDMQNAMLMDVSQVVETIKHNRCEVGTIKMACYMLCCRNDSAGCIARTTSGQFTYHVPFKQPFLEKPVVELTVVGTYEMNNFGGDEVPRGFKYTTDARRVTTEGFDFKMWSDFTDVTTFVVHYSFTWIACVFHAV